MHGVHTRVGVTPNGPLRLLLHNYDTSTRHHMGRGHNFLRALTHLRDVAILPTSSGNPISIAGVVSNTRLLVPVTNLVGGRSRLTHLTGRITGVRNRVDHVRGGLTGRNFITHTPRTIVTGRHRGLRNCTRTGTGLVRRRTIVTTLWSAP